MVHEIKVHELFASRGCIPQEYYIGGINVNKLLKKNARFANTPHINLDKTHRQFMKTGVCKGITCPFGKVFVMLVCQYLRPITNAFRKK